MSYRVLASKNKPNGYNKFAPAQLSAIFEITLADHVSAVDLSNLLSIINWLHESLSGKPVAIDSVRIN